MSAPDSGLPMGVRWSQSSVWVQFLPPPCPASLTSCKQVSGSASVSGALGHSTCYHRNSEHLPIPFVWEYRRKKPASPTAQPGPSEEWAWMFPCHQLPECHSHSGPGVSLCFSCSSYLWPTGPQFPWGGGGFCLLLSVGLQPCPLLFSERHICVPQEWEADYLG